MILTIFCLLGVPIYIERGCGSAMSGIVVEKVDPSLGELKHSHCDKDLCNGRETSLVTVDEKYTTVPYYKSTVSYNSTKRNSKSG